MEPLLTTEEVAEYLRVEVVTVRRLIVRGGLPAYRIGGEFRFTASDVEGFVKSQRVTPNEAFDAFSRFTERTRKVLRAANEEAATLEHNFVGTEHLLLGILGDDESIAAITLVRSGLDLKNVRERILNIVQHMSQHSTKNPKGGIEAAVQNALNLGRSPHPFGERELAIGERGLTARAKKVIELGVDEARRLSHHYIGTEHLLLGMLREGEGIAAQVLIQGCGLQLYAVRELVTRILQTTTPTTPVESSEQSAPPANTNE